MSNNFTAEQIAYIIAWLFVGLLLLWYVASKIYEKGLESGTLTVSFLNDTAAANVMATLRAAFGTTVAVKMLQEKLTAVGATNPLYTFDILVNNLTPINGAVGDIGTQDITFTLNSVVTIADSGTF